MYKVYEVKPGENISTISRVLGVSEEELRKVNGFTPTYEVQVGEVIVIPQTNKMPFSRYTVMKNDTLYSVAKKYNITDDELAHLNGLDKNEYIYPGQELLVPSENVRFHVVSPRETLKDVAKILNVPINDLVKQNDNIFLLEDQILTFTNNSRMWLFTFFWFFEKLLLF